MDVRQTELSNGLRVVTSRLRHVQSISMGIWVGVGGRYESRQLSGISHFIEHLLFKGSYKRSARDISQAIEGRGGHFNAFTSEESTCFYARVGYDQFKPVFEILADMYRNPRFKKSDIEMERGVILEEIMMYRDQPQHLVQDVLGELLWENHPLGRALIGTPTTLARMSRARIVSFKEGRYTPGNTVCAFAGNLDHDTCVAQARKFLGTTRKRRRPTCRPISRGVGQGRISLHAKDIEQAQLALAFRMFGRNDRRRYAARLLSVILGENMSSRLFQLVREKHGLAYSIHSSTHVFADTGAFIVSAGLDRARCAKALKLVIRELNRAKTRRVSSEELQRAKDYVVGQLRLSMESTSQQMMWLGEQLVSYDRIVPPEHVIDRVLAVTAEQVQRVAGQIFHHRRSSLAIVAPDLESADEVAFGKALRGLEPEA
jgi:predicted Zn-dependent peptidase